MFLSLVIGEIDSIRTMVNDLGVAHRSDFIVVDDDTSYVYTEMDVRAVDRRFWSAIDHCTILVPPIVYTDAGTLQLTILGDEEALSRTVDRVPDEITVDVARVGEHRHSLASLAGRLTHRQFEH